MSSLRLTFSTSSEPGLDRSCRVLEKHAIRYVVPFCDPPKRVLAVKPAINPSTAPAIPSKRTRLGTQIGQAVDPDQFVLFHWLRSDFPNDRSLDLAAACECVFSLNRRWQSQNVQRKRRAGWASLSAVPSSHPSPLHCTKRATFTELILAVNGQLAWVDGKTKPSPSNLVASKSNFAD